MLILQCDENFNKMEMLEVMVLQIPVWFIIKGNSQSLGNNIDISISFLFKIFFLQHQLNAYNTCNAMNKVPLGAYKNKHIVININVNYFKHSVLFSIGNRQNAKDKMCVGKFSFVNKNKKWGGDAHLINDKNKC